MFNNKMNNYNNNFNLNQINNLNMNNMNIMKNYQNFNNMNNVNSMNNVNNFNYNNSYRIRNNNLNISDCPSITTNRNEKLNLSVNTIDTIELQNETNEYKILSNNNNITEFDNIYSKQYLSNLNPTDYEYDTFCHAIIKTGLNEGKINLSKYSEHFPAPCGHELCSKLPAFEPKVLNFYQNKDKTNKLDIKQEATSHLIFPLGIKLCVEQDFHNQNI